MLPIPCSLTYCLNIYSVDCHSTKKIQFESISQKYLHIYRNNHMKAGRKPAIPSRCILACMLHIEKQQQTNKKPLNQPIKPPLQNLKKNPDQKTPAPPASRNQTNQNKQSLPHPQTSKRL